MQAIGIEAPQPQDLGLDADQKGAVAAETELARDRRARPIGPDQKRAHRPQSGSSMRSSDRQTLRKGVP